MRQLSALKENNTLSDVDKRESYIKVLIFKINYKVKGTSLFILNLVAEKWKC